VRDDPVQLVEITAGETVVVDHVIGQLGDRRPSMNTVATPQATGTAIRPRRAITTTRTTASSINTTPAINPRGSHPLLRPSGTRTYR
jgi:hypothetical protein